MSHSLLEMALFKTTIELFSMTHRELLAEDAEAHDLLEETLCLALHASYLQGKNGEFILNAKFKKSVREAINSYITFINNKNTIKITMHEKNCLDDVLDQFLTQSYYDGNKEFQQTNLAYKRSTTHDRLS